MPICFLDMAGKFGLAAHWCPCGSKEWRLCKFLQPVNLMKMPFSTTGLYRYIFISASSTFWLQLPSFKWDNWKVKTGPRIPEYGQEKQGEDKIFMTAGLTYVWFMWWPLWFLTLMLISDPLIKKMKQSSHSLKESLNFRGSLKSPWIPFFP